MIRIMIHVSLILPNTVPGHIPASLAPHADHPMSATDS